MASKLSVDDRTLIETDDEGGLQHEQVALSVNEGGLRPWLGAEVAGEGPQADNPTPFFPILNQSPFVYTTLNNDIVNIKYKSLDDTLIDFRHCAKYSYYFTQPGGFGGGTFGPFFDWLHDVTGITIGDVISFRKADGTMTKSQVLDHIIPIDSNAVDNWDFSVINSFDSYLPSKRVEIDQLPAGIGTYVYSFENEPDGLGQVTLHYSANQSDSNGVPSGTIMALETGMEVIGDNIEKGTFITRIKFADDIYDTHEIRLSKKLIGDVFESEGEVTTIITTPITFIQTTGWYKIDKDVYNYPIELGWFNCYAFGNGVESDRIRDDFNAPQIDNGVKASSTFLEYAEQHTGSGLIYSSELYNSTSSINGLNEFSMAQKITKNLNPIYGSIQALKTRDTDVVVFAEDKILKVLANKDAVFNADGNMQLTATNKVLGTAIPFAGDYGISKNPESLAVDQYRMYFTDKQRGSVLRLSQDGLTPISNVGMKSYFREYLRMCDNIVGTFDVVNGEYNIKLGINEVNQNETICNENGCTVLAEPTAVSFNEGSKGWVSFKSFMHSCGVSVTGKYITAPTSEHSITNKIWKHYDKTADRNNFYGEQFSSEIDILFNDQPGSVKSFKTIN